MKWKTITLMFVLGIALVGASGIAVVDHEGSDQCDNLDTHSDAIDEHADEHAEDNNAVDRAQDACNGDHHYDEANDGSDNIEHRLSRKAFLQSQQRLLSSHRLS